MLWYFAAVALHVFAIVCWIGLMSYATLALHPASERGTRGGMMGSSTSLMSLGWLCAIIALVTGAFMLYAQGVSSGDVTSGWVFHGRFGEVLRVKLVLVALLILLQFLVSRRAAVRWVFLIVGLATVGVSTLLIR